MRIGFPLEGAKFLLDLLPRRFATGFVEAGEHLMQRAERFLLEAYALP